MPKTSNRLFMARIVPPDTSFSPTDVRGPEFPRPVARPSQYHANTRSYAHAETLRYRLLHRVGTYPLVCVSWTPARKPRRRVRSRHARPGRLRGRRDGRPFLAPP